MSATLKAESEIQALRDRWSAWELTRDPAVVYRTLDVASGGTPYYWHEIQFKNIGVGEKIIQLSNDGVILDPYIRILPWGGDPDFIYERDLYITEFRSHWSWVITNGEF